MKLIQIILLLVFLFEHANCQNSPVLDSYVKLGLENNQTLQQKQLNLEKSLMALKEANGLFYPSVGFSSQNTLSNGGRSINLPIGDLLNPVYSSLNDLTAQPGAFPQINNEKIQFLPNDYHDTKLRVILPLIKEIKVAYLKHLQSLKVIEAYNSASDLIKEALYVNEKLYKNEMAGKDKVLRFRAELSHVEAQLTKAVNDNKAATAYFNFLVNQPLQTVVMGRQPSF